VHIALSRAALAGREATIRRASRSLLVLDACAMLLGIAHAPGTSLQRGHERTSRCIRGTAGILHVTQSQARPPGCSHCGARRSSNTC
jgi:hypothetical protein